MMEAYETNENTFNAFVDNLTEEEIDILQLDEDILKKIKGALGLRKREASKKAGYENDILAHYGQMRLYHDAPNSIDGSRGPKVSDSQNDEAKRQYEIARRDKRRLDKVAQGKKPFSEDTGPISTWLRSKVFGSSSSAADKPADKPADTPKAPTPEASAPRPVSSGANLVSRATGGGNLKGTGADSNAKSSIPTSQTGNEGKIKDTASHLGGSAPSSAPKSGSIHSVKRASVGANPSDSGVARFGKGGPGGARASSKEVARMDSKRPSASPTQSSKVAGASQQNNANIVKSKARAAIVRQRGLQAARPAARPNRPAKPVRTTANQDFMTNFTREEVETTPPQIKESFERFLKNTFYRG
jgi:hypothetical protein